MHVARKRRLRVVEAPMWLYPCDFRGSSLCHCATPRELCCKHTGNDRFQGQPTLRGACRRCFSWRMRAVRSRSAGVKSRPQPAIPLRFCPSFRCRRRTRRRFGPARARGLVAFGQLQRDSGEMGVLLLLLTECCERRSVATASNLVFSTWDQIFQDPMTTAAAIDRVVHHSVILELNVKSSRAQAAYQRTRSGRRANTDGS